MSSFVDAINTLLSDISNFMYTYILIIILITAGIYFTIRTKAVPITMMWESIRVLREKPHDKESISSFRALMVSTASRVGVGNIAGVAAAIALGGPGAMLWMWVIAFFGGATAFIESTIAQIYKRRSADGHSYGGPAYYIAQALKAPWLGYVFSVCLITCYVGGFNLVAAFNVKDTFTTYTFFTPETTPYIIGAILAVLFFAAIIGGTKKLSAITAVLIPIMAVIYLLLCIILIAVNITRVPDVIVTVIRSAFDFPAIFGGFIGSALMEGIKRGLYSNEAGVGSAPNAAATASVSHPVKQGLVQMLSVWIDTMVICTATALAVLSTGVVGGENLKGTPLVQAAWQTFYGAVGQHLVTLCLCLFAFTTVIGNYYYAEANIAFVLRREARKWELIVFRCVCTLVVFVGAIVEFSLAWNVADVLLGIMVLINVPAILLLGKKALDALEDYRTQRKAGKDPEYVAHRHGVKDVDFWD